jgi:hypothetical protein
VADNATPKETQPASPTPDSRTDRARARELFLGQLERTGNVSGACRAAGIGRSTAYEWRAGDAAFAAQWAEAEETATDALEAEARKRAVDGWDEPVFHQGAPCGTVRKYSDRMLEILLKGHRPKFRDNHRVEVSGPAGAPVSLTLVDVVRAAAAETPGGGGDGQQPS